MVLYSALWLLSEVYLQCPAYKTVYYEHRTFLAIEVVILAGYAEISKCDIEILIGAPLNVVSLKKCLDSRGFLR